MFEADFNPQHQNHLKTFYNFVFGPETSNMNPEMHSAVVFRFEGPGV